MYLGTAKATITPPPGTPLAGFGFRDHGAEAVFDELEVHALWFQGEPTSAGASDAVCIITADLIGFSTSITDAVRAALHQTYGTAPERVLLHASHTHSGPQTCENMIGVGAAVPDVVENVIQRTLEVAEQARRDLRRVTLRAGRGCCEGYAINRRVVTNDRAISGPNPAGVRDDEVTVIACHDAHSDALRALLFHFTCHPTTMGDYRITADYPGTARRHIEQALGGASVAFLQGCCGDVRPNCTFIGGKQFRRGQSEDVIAFGAALGESVLQVVQGSMQALTPALGARTRTLDLPLAGHPSRNELEQLHSAGNALQQASAGRLLASPPSNTRPLTLQRIDLAEEATLIAMGGEVCCDYGHFIKQLGRQRYLLPLGYSNGLVGYIPSARMFREEGYEVTDSCIYFGLPSPFWPDIEPMIQAGIRALME
jgi:hypothetical protein